MDGRKALLTVGALFAATVGPYVIGMLIVVLLIAYVPAVPTVFLPDIY